MNQLLNTKWNDKDEQECLNYWGPSNAGSSKHINMHKYVSSGLWPRITFFELKITNILKPSVWGLEKST